MRRYLTSILLALGLIAPAQAAGLVELALAGSVFSYGDVAFVGATASDPQAALDAYIESLSPTLWIAARKETTYSDTDAVPTATDWSGNGYDATQGTAANQPTYVADGIGGLPTFSFDGNDYLQSTGWTNAQPNNIILVAKYDDIDTNTRMLINSAQISLENGVYTGGGNWSFYGASVVADGSDDSSENVFFVVFNSTSSSMTINGVTAVSGNAGTKSMAGANVGANFDGVSSFWDGIISEAITIQGGLSVEQKQTLVGRLGAVYNITITH